MNFRTESPNAGRIVNRHVSGSRHGYETAAATAHDLAQVPRLEKTILSGLRQAVMERVNPPPREIHRELHRSNELHFVNQVEGHIAGLMKREGLSFEAAVAITKQEMPSVWNTLIMSAPGLELYERTSSAHVWNRASVAAPRPLPRYGSSAAVWNHRRAPSAPTNVHLLNRAFTPSADGWIQVVPKGEFRHRESDLWQVIDDEAARRIVESFCRESARPNFPGVLVDFDHESYDTAKRSTAAGWITSMEARGDGVWAKVEWSEDGEAAVRGGNFRLVSPAFGLGEMEKLGGQRMRPTRLDTVALTNAPGMKGMVPLCH